MQLLNIPAGPIVGKAYEFLLELRIEEGPLGKDRAQEELLKWWKDNRS
jgi:poly(A) polymerase